MSPNLTWLKLGGGVIAAVFLMLTGYQVASWRGRALEADRLEVANNELQQALRAQAAAQRAADAARASDTAGGEQREAELEARIRDLQEMVDIRPNVDCDLPPEVAGVINRAAGHAGR